MSMEYIRETYGVPAKKGGRVKYTNGSGVATEGVITGTHGAYIKVKMDGDKLSECYHPTYNIEYL